LQYQTDAGEAPPVELVLQKYPSFHYTSGISTTWAATQITKLETNRTLRKALAGIANAISEEAHGEAVSLMSEAVRGYSTGNTVGIDALAFDLIRDSDAAQCVPVPGDYLQQLTGGHRSGELWLIAALWGVGKSWRMLEHAVSALEEGWDVAFFSLEMLPAGILKRIHTIALRNTPGALVMSDQERESHVRQWYAQCGELRVYGPSQGRVDASVIAGVIENKNTLVCVDYVGRMYTTAGQPARDDWSKVSMISQELCEYAAMLEVPILAAVQLNRQGSVAGSMDLERDASLLLEIARLSDSCNGARKNTIKKSRSTESLGSWFSRFDAVNGRFEDITSETALEIRLSDESEAL
jgi:hypothetical protein